jgi:hypothetical protein
MIKTRVRLVLAENCFRNEHLSHKKININFFTLLQVIEFFHIVNKMIQMHFMWFYS